MHNYLPSVSAAIGDYIPQRYIWRLVIALHTVPRIQIAFVYYVYFLSILAKQDANTVFFNCILNLVEILSLFGLTFISSTDNYSKFNFFIFNCLIELKLCFVFFSCSNSQSFFYHISSYLDNLHGLVNLPFETSDNDSQRIRSKILSFQKTFIHHDASGCDGSSLLFCSPQQLL